MKEEVFRNKLITVLKNEPIRMTNAPSATLSIAKAAKIAGLVIDVIKDEAGAYKDGETEEITFSSKTWLLTLEEDGKGKGI